MTYDGGPGDDKKKKRRRSKKKGDTPVFAQSNDVVGSCEDGNLKAKKTKVCKANPFNANKKSGLLNTVGSKRKRDREERKENRRRIKAARKNPIYGNPRLL